MCLKDLRDEFLYDCECRHLAKGSQRNYRAATRFLVDFLEWKQVTELEEVKPHHIRDLMKEKQDMGSTPRYINDLLKVWRTWFNYLVNEGYLEERDNPARKVKPLRQPKTVIDTFTVDEMKRMIRFYDGVDLLQRMRGIVFAIGVLRQCSRYLTYWEMVTKLKTLFPILMMRDMISSQKSPFFMITQLRLQQLPRELNRKGS